MRNLIKGSPLIVAAFFGAVGGMVSAQTVPIDVEFRPPEIKPQRVCQSRPADEVTVELWSGWDKKALPNMESAVIKRDLNRLLYIDAAYWFDTVELMITRLAERDPQFDGQNAQLARILALEAVGRFGELKKLQLVEQLAANPEALSPRVKNVLARFYRNGIGVARDIAKADAFLVDAGYAGNADALLQLSQMVLQESQPADWNVPVQLAVSMAFGSLVGELNPTICDRTARIAREYQSGAVVKQDRQLAHDWYRFTADLGDAYAAWKVVEFHTQAEGFEKSNKTLLTYLTMASDAGLPYAQIELGRMYEVGALVKRDLDKALALYMKAAENGERPGLTRVALFLEQHNMTSGAYEQTRLDVLQKLSELSDPPGWAYTRLAEARANQKGFWETLEDTKAIVQNAADLGDLDGTVQQAELLLAELKSETEFEEAVDLLSRAVAINGGATPSKLLYEAFMCKAADAPRVAEAQYWAASEAATASSNLDLSAHEIVQLDLKEDALEIATLQSHALYGRPFALAGWLKLIETADFADDEMRAFWDAYSNRYGQVLKALAKLEFELAENRSQRLAAFDHLREEYKRSGPEAALTLAQALLTLRVSEDDSELQLSREEARKLLHMAALEGKGQAIELIAGLDETPEARKATFETYRDAIAKNGDFHALLFAIPYLTPAQQQLYVTRATGVMHCDYKNAISMAKISFEIEDAKEGFRWLDIAELLTGQNAWALTDLAKLRLDEGGDTEAAKASELLAQAHVQGDGAASRLLFQMYITKDLEVYDPSRASAMIVAAEDSQDYALLSGYLGRYRRVDADIQHAISADLDMPRIYLAAAESGDVFSMRSYGQHLRATATSAGELQASTQWLKLAAEAGDTTAMADFGQALAFGIGIDADSQAALYWLKRAAEGGSKSAARIADLVMLSQGS